MEHSELFKQHDYDIPCASRPYYVQVLMAELDRRKEKNPRYSLRAFAHFLKVHPSALSRVLAGKQDLSIQATHKIVERLGLVDGDAQLFIESVGEILKVRLTDNLVNARVCSSDDRSSESRSGGIRSKIIQDVSADLQTRSLTLDQSRINEIQNLFNTFVNSLERIYGKSEDGAKYLLSLQRLLDKSDTGVPQLPTSGGEG